VARGEKRQIASRAGWRPAREIPFIFCTPFQICSLWIVMAALCSLRRFQSWSQELLARTFYGNSDKKAREMTYVTSEQSVGLEGGGGRVRINTPCRAESFQFVCHYGNLQKHCLRLKTHFRYQIPSPRCSQEQTLIKISEPNNCKKRTKVILSFFHLIHYMTSVVKKDSQKRTYFNGTIKQNIWVHI